MEELKSEMNKTGQVFKVTPREGAFAETLANKVSFETVEKTSSFKPDVTSGSGK